MQTKPKAQLGRPKLSNTVYSAGEGGGHSPLSARQSPPPASSPPTSSGRTPAPLTSVAYRVSRLGEASSVRHLRSRRRPSVPAARLRTSPAFASVTESDASVMPPKVTIAASNDAVLPEDMLHHILVRLPAKTLCLFRAVCPSWRSLLSDPLFVAAHKSHHPEPLIVTCNCEMFERGTINIMDLSGHVVKRIATTMKNARMVRTRRLDLICVTGHKGRHVINPVTGDTFALPSCRAKEHAHVQHFFPESFDLGQVVTTGEYKALRCVSIDNSDHESSPMLCEVITLDDGRNARWRGKQGPPPPVTSNRNRSIVVKGVVYFLLDFLYKRFTFSGVRVKPGSMALFNLETEEWMGIVQGPKPVRSFVKDSNGRCGYFSLYLELSPVNLDGFLVMAHNPEGCSLDLWFLMDSEKCLWNKSYSLDFQPENLFAQPLEILNDGKIVLSAPGSLRLYNPVTKTYIDFGMRNSTSVGTYTGSLLSSESTFTSEAERCTACGCYFTLEAGQHDVTCQDCMYEAVFARR
ncbi:F-box protein At3g07870 isoform X4 [Triticum aestivum]|nr:F-box protein At3g07870-like isoform X4 [Triticum aestivum]